MWHLVFNDYQYVSASPGIDVLSYHDYYGTAALGGDQWNGLAVRFAQMIDVGKPIVGGEVGMRAGSTPGCVTTTVRDKVETSEERNQSRYGSSGFLIWNWVPTASSPCTFDVTPRDPNLLRGGVVG